MFYRVAIQADTSTRWRWCSTMLSSLDAVFRFLQLNYAPLEHLLVFSSGLYEEIDEQLARENQGLPSKSVMATRFLHERLILSLEGTRATPARETAEDQLMTSIAVAAHSSGKIRGSEVDGLVGNGMSALERRRLEFELGPGGDHDVPYRFVLPAELLPALVWMKLLAGIERGELQP
jgi:hypothetical protein